MEKRKGLLTQGVTYTLAILTAILVGKQFPEAHPLVVVAIADIAATVVVFVCGLVVNNSSLYDPYWSVKPMVIAAYFWAIAPEPMAPAVLLGFVLMQLYGLRLTSNFLRDWPGLSKEDWRYVNFRKQFPKTYWLVSFSGIHLFPTIMVYLACIPAYYVIVEGSGTIQLLTILGALLYAATIVLSYVADEQMRNFREQATNKGKTMMSGLWKHSRHPNYLGEVLGWWGLWLMAIAESFSNYWTGIGALVITLLFFFISIPLMDKRSLERRPEFQEYMERTPSLFPKPWK